MTTRRKKLVFIGGGKMGGEKHAEMLVSCMARRDKVLG